ncbi:MAG: hypothetical protein CO093_11600 [Alphaproteobacteria bacterium CG_4_9_14_3_um_filter_47_13]|nr:MAG: hypothetical protein CO093_11600 [Alphaproteobacteria bacterium CG_4_9_14_3_um_filter_47_13]
MLEWIFDPAIWASFVTLSVLEIVLGIDNIIFLSIITSALPREKQPFARFLGLSLALVMRVALLSCIVWLERLDTTLFSVMDQDISWRDLVLVGGGLFLLYKATVEIHHDVEAKEEVQIKPKTSIMTMVVMQIVAIDLVFSLDSIFTAVGVADHLPVMVAAVVLAILVMMFAADPVSNFVQAHPTIKMLALSFLLLVGMMLVADGLGMHVPRGYLYFAICFSLGVETLNQLADKRRKAKRELS